MRNKFDKKGRTLQRRNSDEGPLRDLTEELDRAGGKMEDEEEEELIADPPPPPPPAPAAQPPEETQRVLGAHGLRIGRQVQKLRAGLGQAMRNVEMRLAGDIQTERQERMEK